MTSDRVEDGRWMMNGFSTRTQPREWEERDNDDRLDCHLDLQAGTLYGLSFCFRLVCRFVGLVSLLYEEIQRDHHRREHPFPTCMVTEILVRA